MSKKNLMLIVPSLTMGGQEKIAVTMAELFKCQYHVTLVIFEHCEMELPVSVPVVCLDSPAAAGKPLHQLWQILKRNAALRKLKKSLHTEIAYSLGEPADVSNLLSRVGEKTIPTIHGFNSVPTSAVKKTVYRWLFRRAFCTVCASCRLAESFAQAIGLPLEKCVGVYNPIEMKEICKKSEEQTPQLLGSPALLAVGRLAREKNYMFLLETVARMKAKYPQVGLNFVGDGDYAEPLRAKTAELGLAQNVRFHGLQVNPYCYMKACDALVLSSYTEGLPGVLVEGLCCGAAIVSTDCMAGPREILAPGTMGHISDFEPEYAQFGVLVPSSGPEDTAQQRSKKSEVFAQALERLTADAALRSSYCEKAPERAADFSGENYKNALCALFEDS